jgi:hypothetical protein
MKFNIETNGGQSTPFSKVTIAKEIPESWDKVSFRKFHEITKCGNDVNSTISILTEVPRDILLKAKIKGFDVLLSCLAFTRKPVDQLMPSSLLDLPVPKRLEDEAAGRFGDLQEIIKKFVKDDSAGNLSHYPLIVATYITPSPYNFNEAEALAEKLWEAPCGEVLATGNFILMRLSASKDGMLNSSHLEGTLKNRLRRATINWLTRLAFSIRYGTWKRSLPLSVRKSLNGL